jgi:addiction module HigA family antidote
MANSRKTIFAIHPGEILKTEFMEPMDVSAFALAKALHFPGIYEVVRGERAISADTALRLGRYFGLPARFWLNLQNVVSPPETAPPNESSQGRNPRAWPLLHGRAQRQLRMASPCVLCKGGLSRNVDSKARCTRHPLTASTPKPPGTAHT